MTTDASAGASDTISRRGLLKAAASTGGAAAAIAFPAVVRAQTPVKWRVQTAHVAGTVGYTGVPEVLHASERAVGGEGAVPAVSGGRDRRHFRHVRRGEGWRSRRHARLQYLLVREHGGRGISHLVSARAGPARPVGDVVLRARRTADRAEGVPRPQPVLRGADPARSEPDSLQGSDPLLRGVQGQEDPFSRRDDRGDLQARRRLHRDPARWRRLPGAGEGAHRRRRLHRPRGELRSRLRRGRKVHHHGAAFDAVPPPAGGPHGPHGQHGQVDRACPSSSRRS